MKIAKRLLSIIVLVAVIFTFSGCAGGGGDDDGMYEAESLLKIYFSALSGFNTDVMETCLVSDNEYSVGFSIETISDQYNQTNYYKKQVEKMFKGLGNTFSFTINSSEMVDESTVKFNVTVSHASVNEDDVNDYVQEKVDDYVTMNPEYFAMTEIEQNDVSIAVMADAYNRYLQIAERVTNDIDILVTKVEGSWKIETAKNHELFSLLAEVFAE